jgi:outer membrane murein-binding lipoprotein Lpp
MIRPLAALAAAATVALVAPALSEEAASGRFEVSPADGGGFIRLDTRTGSVSHCGQRDAVWFCEVLADGGLKEQVTDLSVKVDRLSADLDRLAARVDQLAATGGAGSPGDGRAEEEIRPAEEPGFANRAVRRFFDMVRELKNDRAGQT